MRAARPHSGEGLRVGDVPRPEAGAGEPLVQVAGAVIETGEGVGVDEGTDVTVPTGTAVSNTTRLGRQ